MISREEYNKALDTVEAYHKQLFIGDVGISNMMQEDTAKMTQDIATQKELVIKQKLKEIVGIDINLEEELQRRFKRF